MNTKTMNKQEFMEYCKTLDQIFDEKSNVITLSEVDSFFDPHSMITVLETPATGVFIMHRKNNLGGTTQWRGIKK